MNLCYRNRSFCADQDQCATVECQRRYTKWDEKRNENYQLPVAWMSMKDGCRMYKEKEE